MFCKHAFACLALVLAAAAANGQTCPVTGLPADGSMAAREAMPGFVYVIRYEDVFLAGIKEKNNGQWVASDNPLSAYGRIRESGNIVVGHTFDIPLGTLIDSGVLKNPGPAPLQVELFTPAGVELIEVAPGEAVEVGSVITDVLMTEYEWKCRCTCDVGGSDETLDENFHTGCCEHNPPSCTCGCMDGDDGNDPATCWTTESYEGKVTGCKSGLMPKPQPDTGD